MSPLLTTTRGGMLDYMARLDTFDDLSPAEWEPPAEREYSVGLWDQENDDNLERWAREEFEPEPVRALHRPLPLDRRMETLGKMAERVEALRFLDAPAPDINVALWAFWETCRMGPVPPSLNRLADEARQSWESHRQWELGNMIWVKAWLDPPRVDRELEELIDAAGLSERDREIAVAMRTPPHMSLTQLAERFSVSYQMIQKAEKRIRAKCREAAMRISGDAPEWTMERARRRPGVRGPARNGRVTRSKGAAA